MTIWYVSFLFIGVHPHVRPQMRRRPQDLLAEPALVLPQLLDGGRPVPGAGFTNFTKFMIRILLSFYRARIDFSRTLSAYSY
jgi:hypothetical protein